VFFTGSQEAGAQIAAAAAAQLKPVHLEMGGKDAAYVHSSVAGGGGSWSANMWMPGVRFPANYMWPLPASRRVWTGSLRIDCLLPLMHCRGHSQHRPDSTQHSTGCICQQWAGLLCHQACVRASHGLRRVPGCPDCPSQGDAACIVVLANDAQSLYPPSWQGMLPGSRDVTDTCLDCTCCMAGHACGRPLTARDLPRTTHTPSYS
jgi:hypothetical protein